MSMILFLRPMTSWFGVYLGLSLNFWEKYWVTPFHKRTPSFDYLRVHIKLRENENNRTKRTWNPIKALMVYKKFSRSTSPTERVNYFECFRKMIRESFTYSQILCLNARNPELTNIVAWWSKDSWSITSRTIFTHKHLQNRTNKLYLFTESHHSSTSFWFGSP